jgi:glycyl-tRNA synthetase
VFRTREFEQMEMQFFVDPAGDHMRWFETWKAARMEWHRALGLGESRLHFHQHTPQELAHYARAAFDIQFDFGGTLGFQEIEGVHHRGDFDLSRHQEYSGKKLEYFDQTANRRYVPYVIETSVGADRVTLAALVNAYREEEVPGEAEGRVVLGLHPAIAPIKAGIFPLVKKDGMPSSPSGSRRSCGSSSRCSTTRAGPSGGATGGRTRSGRRTASRSTGRRWRTAR